MKERDLQGLLSSSDKSPIDIVTTSISRRPDALPIHENQFIFHFLPLAIETRHTRTHTK